MPSGALRSLLLGVQQIDSRFTRWHRRDSRAVMLNLRVPMNLVVMAPLFKAVAHDPRVRFYAMMAERRSTGRLYEHEGPRPRLLTRAQAAMMKFDACIAADFVWGFLPRGTPRVQMFHGVAGKYSHIYDRPTTPARDWHRLLFINRRRLRNFVSAGAIDPDSPAARLVGMPKLDCLVDGSLRRDCVLESLHIDPSRRTVLYAPTWSPYSSLNVMGEAVVSRLIEAGYVVMVKLHDRSHDPEHIHSGGINWRERLTPLLQRGRGVLIEAADSSPYLVAADLLVTDHSSIGFEYLLLDRPLVRIEMPDLIANTNISPEYVELLASASTSIRAADQVVAAVEWNLEQPGRQSETRKAVGHDLFHRPGTATIRAIKELYEVLELDPPIELISRSADRSVTTSSH